TAPALEHRPECAGPRLPHAGQRDPCGRGLTRGSLACPEIGRAGITCIRCIRPALSLSMNQVVSIEREFGVPIPGEILHPSRWTQTALKKMPAEGHLNWSELFGRDAPVVLDLGCGNGRYLIGSALLRSDHD